MGRLGFTSSQADPDVWFRLSKRSTGEEYYEYVLLYVNGVLVSLRRLKLSSVRKLERIGFSRKTQLALHQNIWMVSSGRLH